jgi:hypothetical protein
MLTVLAAFQKYNNVDIATEEEKLQGRASYTEHLFSML